MIFPKITNKHIDAACADLAAKGLSTADVCNKAIEIALTEQEQPLISAEEARKLGARNADIKIGDTVYVYDRYLFAIPLKATVTRLASMSDGVEVALAQSNNPNFPVGSLFWAHEAQLRVIKQPEPVEPTCQIKNLDTGVTETMTREAAKLLQAELGNTVEWFFPNGLDFGNHFVAGFKCDGIYTYKLKAKLVKLNGKLVTREAATALWESKKDTCDLHYLDRNSIWTVWLCPTVSGFSTIQEYQLRERPLKQISWKDVPVGVMTNKGELRNVFGIKAITETSEKSKHGYTSLEHLTCTLELAPADQQPWLNWRGGECPAPKGVIVEYMIRIGDKVRTSEATVLKWTHCSPPAQTDIIEYRVVGIADGYVLGGEKQ